MNDTTERYFNRELSWLEFNQRVLDEACEPANPLLERLKFLAITGSNLEEFFMVRVGGLQLVRDSGADAADPASLAAAEQLGPILERVRRMVEDQYRCLSELEELLAEHGIRRLRAIGLSEAQRQSLERNYVDEIVSTLAPMAIDDEEEMPHLRGGGMHLAFRLRDADPLGKSNDDEAGSERFVVIALAPVLPRLLVLPSERGCEFLMLEEAIELLADRFFPHALVLEATPFRMTRNADMRVREDSAGDLMTGMQEILLERKWSDCVRLEVAAGASQAMREFLGRSLGAEPGDVFDIPGPLDLSAWMSLTGLHGYESLKAEPWAAQPSPAFDPAEPIFAALQRQSVLLYHPYESFEPVVRMIEQAAEDPDVIAIKQTLYRTSKDSPIIKALARAAENGKNVTALVELKARFDEQRNIEWARRLETAGVHVIHGVKGLKTHAKICIVVRREPQGVQRYVHFGTGNYNETTARIYSDASYLTADDDLGADAVAFFNAISGFSQPLPFRRIEAAPLGLRDKLLELIDIEIQRTLDGQKGMITAKLNSLVDPTLIEALYAASQAGVEIRLNVRGICCLRPGVPGMSQNIRVTSIVDRFLEHARIMHFHHGGDDLVFLSSADWMQRNLDKRIELLVPIDDAEARRRLIDILDTHFRDNVKARALRPDGRWIPVRELERSKGRSTGLVRSQLELWRQATDASEQQTRQRLTRFQPHQGPDDNG
ncbi:MAG TPA: polyphosphate kinase 1 [Planctomycetaceae bacterium]|nr:polyphosphate kinase 1 [Planctomycetaceae bacterium]HRF00788.1 polyphosphate kinase 1 [Pirellulaceae bacterium]